MAHAFVRRMTKLAETIASLETTPNEGNASETKDFITRFENAQSELNSIASRFSFVESQLKAPADHAIYSPAEVKQWMSYKPRYEEMDAKFEEYLLPRLDFLKKKLPLLQEEERRRDARTQQDLEDAGRKETLEEETKRMVTATQEAHDRDAERLAAIEHQRMLAEFEEQEMQRRECHLEMSQLLRKSIASDGIQSVWEGALLGMAGDYENLTRFLDHTVELLDAIVKNPNELCYRVLKATNERFEKNIGEHPAGAPILVCVGFQCVPHEVIQDLYPKLLAHSSDLRWSASDVFWYFKEPDFEKTFEKWQLWVSTVEDKKNCLALMRQSLGRISKTQEEVVSIIKDACETYTEALHYPLVT